MKKLIKDHDIKKQGNVNRWKTFIHATSTLPGGRHVDIFDGKYVRRPNTKNMRQWKKVSSEKENIVLYDGFFHWKKSYGPLYNSWSFGKNHFINVNTYDLRQHRRTGWGMYTVNYGGGVSGLQMDWFRAEAKRAQSLNRDIIIISHHDPRGGVKGRNFPYYFRQVDFTGLGVSARNYILGEIARPKLCNEYSKLIYKRDTKLNCLQDGLQEWMRPDSDFDCHNDDLYKKGKRKGYCKEEIFKVADGKKDKTRPPTFSGHQYINLLAKTKNAATLLLGHTHYNSMEVLLKNDEIIPKELILDPQDHAEIAAFEAANPVRAKALETQDKGNGLANALDNTYQLLSLDGIIKENKEFYKVMFEKTGEHFENKLKKHELVVLRMTTIVDLTTQQVPGKEDGPAYGFAAFDIFKNKGDENPKLNRVYYFKRDKEQEYILHGSVNIDRTTRLKVKDELPKNQLRKLYYEDGKEL